MGGILSSVALAHPTDVANFATCRLDQAIAA
jgi:hypothetical protein